MLPGAPNPAAETQKTSIQGGTPSSPPGQNPSSSNPLHSYPEMKPRIPTAPAGVRSYCHFQSPASTLFSTPQAGKPPTGHTARHGVSRPASPRAGQPWVPCPPARLQARRPAPRAPAAPRGARSASPAQPRSATCTRGWFPPHSGRKLGGEAGPPCGRKVAAARATARSGEGAGPAARATRDCLGFLASVAKLARSAHGLDGDLQILPLTLGCRLRVGGGTGGGPGLGPSRGPRLREARGPGASAAFLEAGVAPEGARRI